MSESNTKFLKNWTHVACIHLLLHYPGLLSELPGRNYLPQKWKRILDKNKWPWIYLWALILVSSCFLFLIFKQLSEDWYWLIFLIDYESGYSLSLRCHKIETGRRFVEITYFTAICKKVQKEINTFQSF
jgi:hypothetical protein